MIELLSITVDPAYARRLWAWPGNTVCVDLEITGKERRQAARDTVINHHSLADAEAIAALPERGPLLVRVNAVAHGGAEEAAALVQGGELRPEMDRLMLPMFRTRGEVDAVVAAIGQAGGGALPPRLTLLAETLAAVEGLEEIVAGQPDWVDHVHLGLNDLALERGTGFLFAPVATGEVAELARRVRKLGRRFGFGGVGMPERGDLVPAEWILGEHVGVGSSCVILSRAFHAAVESERPDDPADPRSLAGGLAAVRRWEAHWRAAPPTERARNHRALAAAIEAVG